MLPLDKQNVYRARYAHAHPGWRTSGAEFEELVRHRLQTTSRVLDVGCGRGGVMELFWRDVTLPIGLDPDRRSLIEHRAHMPRVCGLSEALPFGDGAFDVVIGLWVLEHLPRPEVALREARRVLVPGGCFLFLTPNALHPLIWANRASQWLPAVQRALIPALYGRAEADTFRVRYRANTPTRLRALAGACGFRVEQLRAIADPTYLAFSDMLFRASSFIERILPESWGVHLLGEWVRQM